MLKEGPRPSPLGCGRTDEGENVERLRRLARTKLRRCAPEEIVAENPSSEQSDASYGDVYVLEQPWLGWGSRRSLARSWTSVIATSTSSGRSLRWSRTARWLPRRRCTAGRAGSWITCASRGCASCACGICTVRSTSSKRARNRAGDLLPRGGSALTRFASPESAYLALPWHASLLGQQPKNTRRRWFTCRGRPGLRQMASTAPFFTRFAGYGLPCLPQARRPAASGGPLHVSSSALLGGLACGT